MSVSCGLPLVGEKNNDDRMEEDRAGGLICIGCLDFLIIVHSEWLMDYMLSSDLKLGLPICGFMSIPLNLELGLPVYGPLIILA